MRTPKGFACAIVRLAVVLAAGATSSARVAPEQAASDSEYRLIDALNDRIQERFKNLRDNRFGYGRVAVLPRTPHQFDAESVSEADVLRDLERAGLRVVVYVTGRTVLRSDRTESSRQALARLSLVKGPAIVTPRAPAARGATPPPAATDLIEEGRNAMLAFGEVDSTEFTRPGWTFIARPVRASDDLCYGCHLEISKSRFESLIGAVLYGYRPIG